MITYRKEAAISFIASFILIAVARHNSKVYILMADRFLSGAGWIEIALLAGYCGFITDKLMDPSLTSKWRQRIWLLFSILFFSQLILGLVGLEMFLMTGKLHLPVPALILAGPLYRGSGFFMVILFLSSMILLGPAWCSYLCYFGAWDGVLSRMKKRPAKDLKWLWPMRIVILLLTLLIAPGLRLAGVSGTAAVSVAAAFGVAGILVMVFVSRKKGVMVHCVSYCPMGILSNIMGRISPFRIRISDDCTDCLACTMACRYNALSKEHVENRKPGLTCTLCGDCMAACKHNAIGYRYFRMGPESARRLFIIMAAVMHTVFLGIARI